MTDERLHVLTFGGRWPPETFIARRMERLAASGFRVTHASVAQVDRDAQEVTGVRHLAVLRGRRAPVHVLAQLMLHLPRAFVRSPRRAAALLKAARCPSVEGRPRTVGEIAERTAAYARLALARPDVVHFDWTAAASSFTGLPEALGCPFVVSLHGSELQVYPYTSKGRAATRGLPSVFATAAAVHAVSERVVEIAASYGLARDKVITIPAAADHTFFTPPDSPPDSSSFTIVCIATLRWVKGLEYALLAVAELRRRGAPARLELLGGDPTYDVSEASEGDRIRAAMSDLGLDGTVRLHGYTTPVNVRELLRGAHVYLQTSLSEGHPTAVVEAMACGLPIAATDAGGTREAVTDGVEGFLLPLRDPVATADALERLWRDPGLRARMGAAARRRVEQEFTLDLQTSRFADLYRRAVDRGPE